MIKIQIHKLSSGWRVIHNKSVPVADYLYLIKIFGIIIHSVTLYDIDYDTRERLFKGKNIIKTK